MSSSQVLPTLLSRETDAEGETHHNEGKLKDGIYEGERLLKQGFRLSSERKNMVEQFHLCDPPRQYLGMNWRIDAAAQRSVAERAHHAFRVRVWRHHDALP